MCPWLSGDDKAELMGILQAASRVSPSNRENLIRAKMDLDATEAQTKAALAEERAAIASEIAAKASVQNAKYMLWSVIAAAVSAIASLGSAVLAVMWHKG